METGRCPPWLFELLQSYGFTSENSREQDASRRHRVTEQGTRAPGSGITYYKPQDEDEEEFEEVKPIIRVKSVDFLVKANAKQHRTDRYEVTHAEVDDKPNIPQLVVRRGEPFEIMIETTQPMVESSDKISLTFDIISSKVKPLVSKDTRINIPLKSKHSSDELWTAKPVEYEGNTARVRITSPANAYVGRLRLHVDSVRKNRQQEDEMLRYTCPNSITILFNPWCKDDAVFLNDELALSEYILNDVGKIYSGNYRQIRAKPWNFGQFESVSLDTALYLLEQGSMQVRQRGNPTHIARKLSAMVNAQDDNGVLVGNWTGNYHGGTRPTAWVGSVSILEEYWKTKKPVNYGQCWVFSGLVTTLCRALGIPCRSVTNFMSAHDTDGSITIDKHFDENDKPLKEYDSDSVWNFHVWNDVWMARPDLPPGFGGWQAIDATPQETSDGMFRAGPASVAAIKRGEVTLPYDTPFIFAEVNADRIYWTVDKMGNFSRLRTKRLSVGKNISTKKPNGKAPSRYLGPFSYFNDDKDRLDVTTQYKFRENTQEERTSVLKAVEGAGLAREGAYDEEPEDMEFELIHEDGVMIGKPFTVMCRMKNLQSKEREIRNVHVTMAIHVITYNGIRITEVKSKKESYEIKPKSDFEALLVVSPDDYLDALIEQAQMQISVMCRVAETNQVYVDDDDFRLVLPDVDVECPRHALTKQTFGVRLSVKNPLPRTLTSCKFRVEGPGLQKPLFVRTSSTRPGKVASVDLKMTGKMSGRRQILASFDCKQLTEVMGSGTIRIAEEGEMVEEESEEEYEYEEQ